MELLFPLIGRSYDFTLPVSLSVGQGFWGNLCFPILIKGSEMAPKLRYLYLQLDSQMFFTWNEPERKFSWYTNFLHKPHIWQIIFPKF